MKKQNKNRKSQEKSINIKGMHCKSCVNLIESTLSQLKGVKKVKVSLVENKALVRFNPNVVSLNKIKSKIDALGYSTGGGKPSGTKRKTILQGVGYALIPHIGCIGFIIASILGATVAMKFFKPLLMNYYFFHILVAISLLFATIASVIYLRKNGFLSLVGIKRKWRYISIMYGSTVGINLLLFIVIFPLLANVSAPSVTGAFVGVADGDIASLKLKVNIPCPGHAPLISEELQTLDGIVGIQFSFPNTFDVNYDSTKTSKQEMLSLEVFDVYTATVLEESDVQQDIKPQDGRSSGGGCGCGGSTCGRSGGNCCGA